MRAALLSAAAAAVLVGGCAKPVKPGDPVRGLTREQRDRFRRGGEVFDTVFTAATGLGPLFNSTSCDECHEDPAPGGFGDEVEVHATAFHPGALCDPLVHQGGPVIQQDATPALKTALGVEREPNPPDATALARRTAPVVFGRGLLDAVPNSAFLAYADPDDRNGDGVSGRPNHFFDGRIGRFGRKALVPTLREFNEGAFVLEQGVTTPAIPTEETFGGRPLPAGVDPAPDPEITDEIVALTDTFVRFLGAPTPLRPSAEARQGRDLFGRIGCAACHVPALRTGDSPITALRRREVGAYSDLLLHDMGPELADVCLGDATPSEFRTEPLIGLRLATRFLHDGRATTAAQAIELHGGEAAGARTRFLALTPGERAALVAFLKTL